MIWSRKRAAIRTFEKQLAGIDLEVVETSADVVLLDHGHTKLHILFVLEGALQEDTRVFAAGDVRISPAGDRHFARFLEPSRCLLLHLHASSELEETRHRWSVQLSEVLPKAITIADEITGNPWIEEERAQEFAGQLQTRLLAETIKSRTDKAPSWLGELHTSIQSMEAIHSVRQLAQAAGVSREHLSRLFTRYYAVSLGSYLQRQRIAAAFRQIQRTTYPLAQIAYECGFADQSHMTRTFAYRFGMTPGTLRLFGKRSDEAMDSSRRELLSEIVSL